MMLSENIKKYRKANNMSQDELAEKLNISRQSISLWENGQAQPTIDNIIALTEIFGISSDELLGNKTVVKENNVMQNESEKATVPPFIHSEEKKKSKGKTAAIIAVVLSLVIALIVVVYFVLSYKSKNSVNTSADVKTQTEIQADEKEDFDLFNCCKDFAIQNGELNGDYCIYQQPSTLYGGYDDEYFSISYWGDSNMVEFCLHCPLDDTYSINFYIRMRNGYDGKYEYLSSKYYRSDGVSLRSASGYIDPAVFTENYPLSCDSYEGSTDGQDDFMEESRVGICDLIKCIKEFVNVEDIDCDFGDFEFAGF